MGHNAHLSQASPSYLQKILKNIFYITTKIWNLYLNPPKPNGDLVWSNSNPRNTGTSDIPYIQLSRKILSPILAPLKPHGPYLKNKS